MDSSRKIIQKYANVPSCLGKVETKAVECVHYLMMAFQLGYLPGICGQCPTLIDWIVENFVHQVANFLFQITALLMKGIQIGGISRAKCLLLPFEECAICACPQHCLFGPKGRGECPATDTLENHGANTNNMTN
jgi:hypothetical protein